jgi:hypothetical protein
MVSDAAARDDRLRALQHSGGRRWGVSSSLTQSPRDCCSSAAAAALPQIQVLGHLTRAAVADLAKPHRFGLKLRRELPSLPLRHRTLLAHLRAIRGVHKIGGGSIVASRSGTVATPRQPRRARAMTRARAQDVRRGPVGTVDEVFQVVGRAAPEQERERLHRLGRCSAFATTMPSGTYMKKTPFNPTPDRCANAAALKTCP